MKWNFWSSLFDSSGFMPRRYCGGAWTQDLIWMHNASDFLIWAAYLAIPVVLVFFAWKRRNELPFRSLFWLFGLFIIACGTTHLMDIVMFYNPVYRLAGLVKLITAAASWGTVFALVRLVPQALDMRSPQDLLQEVAARTRELEVANAELKASNDRFSAIVQASSQIFWTRNAHGEFVEPQPSWSAFTGQSFDDLKGMGWLQAVHPDDRERVAQVWSEAIARGGNYKSEYLMCRHDGEYRCMEIRGAPVLDASGQIREWVGTNTDVTERNQTTAALRDSEARKASILQTALDCIITIDHESRIVEWNPAAERTFGYSREEALGKPLPDLVIPPSLRAGHYSGMQKYLTTGIGAIINQRVEVNAVRADGTEFPVELSVTRIRNEGTAFFTAYLRDITARKQAEIELERARDSAEAANKTKSLFLANMSHELRTPLNAVLGYSEMLQDEAQERALPEMATDLGRINAAGKHLLSLINDVLDLSKIEAGKMEVYIEDFEVRSMIEEAAATMLPLIEKNRNTLEIKISDELGDMRSDLIKVRQALLNLLSNATKFTENGSIVVEAEREVMNDEDWVVLRVSDTGIGMTTEQLIKLFRPFTQADASTTRRFGGTGLGLTLTRSFCQMLGGDVTVASTPGQGSTFSIKLPLALTGQPGRREISGALEEYTVSALQKESETPRDRPEPGTCVLVIDDDATQRDMLQRFLEQEGFVVCAAHGGEEGLELARLLQPLAITLDVMMPDVDGWSVLNTLKSDPKVADIPIIMLTMVDDKNYGYAIGAADFLTKPVHRERLSSILRKYACPLPPCSVLLVEDDYDVRSITRIMLEAEGWRVVEAVNGREALDCVERSTPSLILLDLMMPEMDGFEFAASLRQRQEWKYIPVIVLTAMELSPEDRQRLGGNVQRVLQKTGQSREELLALVRDLINDFSHKRN
jgi:PAS domain S-box-containing protein